MQNGGLPENDVPEICEEYIRDAVDYFRRALLLHDDSMNKFAHWYGVFSRINEAAHIGNGNQRKERLEMLLPDLIDTFQECIQAFENEKSYFKSTPFEDPKFDIVIQRLKTMTDEYQRRVHRVISGEAKGDILIHRYETRSIMDSWFGPFVSEIHPVGAPSGIKPAQEYLATLIIARKDQHPEERWQERALAIHHELKKDCPDENGEGVVCEALRLLNKRKYEKLGEYVRGRYRAYMDYMAKQGR